MNHTFLLGAGFNLDANSLVAPYPNPHWPGREDKIHEPYLDMRQFASHIFPGEHILNFEERIDRAIKSGEVDCLKKFVKKLMYADHYIAGQLKGNHVYQRFLEYCGTVTFLTFNYDAFLEIQLFKKDLWYPHDGFGVQSTAETYPGSKLPSDAKSTNKVLHLHGTYLLYSVDFTISPSGDKTSILMPEKPRFIFDPEGLSEDFSRKMSQDNFLFYPARHTDLGYKHPQNRILAPIPDKAQGFTEPYIKECYSQAVQTIRQAETLIAIGYSFPASDFQSYSPLLKSLFDKSKGELIVVNPQAETIVRRLQEDFPGRHKAIELSFRNWAEQNFPL